MHKTSIGEFYKKLRKIGILFITVPLGGILVLSVFWEVRTLNLERLQKKIDNDAYYISNTVKSKLDAPLIVLEALPNFYMSSDKADENQFDFLVGKTVYRKNVQFFTVEQRRAALRGDVLVVFGAEDMVKELITLNQSESLVINLVDITDSENGQFIFCTNPDLQETSASSAIAFMLPTISDKQDYFNFIGRRWRIRVEAEPYYIHDNFVLSHWCCLLYCGLLTLLFPLIIRSLHNEIAQRKRIEGALKMSEEELMQKNIELATAFESVGRAQAKLIQQEKLAGIGQLAAGVAHEINNPLGFVILNVETLENYFDTFTAVFTQYRELCLELSTTGNMALKEKIDQVARLEKEKDMDYILNDLPELFHDTNEGLNRMSQIVKGMRLCSRIDQQQVFELYDLNDGLKNTLLIVQNKVKYNATVEENLNPIPEIEAIGSEINQVLLNLIINAVQAIKAKDSGNMGIIKISTSHEGDFVYFNIEDSGGGIVAENLNNIFNPFFTTKPVGQGTGLGLSISYDIIVNHHNGEIIVESVPDKGTKFSVKLPIKHVFVETATDNSV